MCQSTFGEAPVSIDSSRSGHQGGPAVRIKHAETRELAPLYVSESVWFESAG